jgi:hypothetical protein
LQGKGVDVDREHDTLDKEIRLWFPLVTCNLHLRRDHIVKVKCNVLENRDRILGRNWDKITYTMFKLQTIFNPFLPGGGGGYRKEETLKAFELCPNYVQEFGLSMRKKPFSDALCSSTSYKNSFRNLTSTNSQYYAQKPQRNRTFMNWLLDTSEDYHPV